MKVKLGTLAQTLCVNRGFTVSVKNGVEKKVLRSTCWWIMINSCTYKINISNTNHILSILLYSPFKFKLNLGYSLPE